MKIIIECECGNNVVVDARSKKYTQFRDGLENKMFHYDGAEIKDNKLKEIRISCTKCRSWITLGMD